MMLTVNLVRTARFSPLEVERPHPASTRTSPHPIRRTPALEANGGESPAANVGRLERDSVRRHGRTRAFVEWDAVTCAC